MLPFCKRYALWITFLLISAYCATRFKGSEEHVAVCLKRLGSFDDDSIVSLVLSLAISENWASDTWQAIEDCTRAQIKVLLKTCDVSVCAMDPAFFKNRIVIPVFDLAWECERGQGRGGRGRGRNYYYERLTQIA